MLDAFTLGVKELSSNLKNPDSHSNLVSQNEEGLGTPVVSG